MNGPGEPAREPDRFRPLPEAAHACVSDLKIEEVLDRVLVLARELTGARYAAIGVLDDGRTQLAQFRVSGVDTSVQAAIGDRPRGRGVLGLLISDPQPLRLASVGVHPLSYGFPPRHPPMTSFLGVPIMIDDQAWGNLYLTEKRSAAEFSDRDEETALALAEWAATAIAEHRWFDHSEQERVRLERTVATLQAARAGMLAIGDAPELSRAFELLVKRGRAVVDARSLLMLAYEGAELVLMAGAGEGLPRSGLRLPVSATQAESLMEAQHAETPQRAADALRPVLTALGMTEVGSVLVAAVVPAGERLGVLIACDRREPRATFGAGDRELLRAFAASGATAMALAQHAERLRSQTVSADADRVRWARRLRREADERLVRMRLRLVDAACPGDPAALAAAVRTTTAALDETIAQLRSLIEDLEPAAEDDDPGRRGV